MSLEPGHHLTGKALLARMQLFLEQYRPLLPQLKVTSFEGRTASVHIIRCMLLEKFLSVLDDEAILAHIQNEHNIISLFLHDTLDPGTQPVINVHDEAGIEIDVHIHGKKIELKTTRDVDASDVPDIIHHWFDAMIDTQGDKDSWWLVYFVQRPDTKAQIGVTCLYYITAIEIPTRGIDERDEDSIISEAVALIQKAEKKVKKEDGIVEGALLPVDNVVNADRLRKKLKARDETIQNMEKTIEAKEKTIEAKEKTIEAKDNTIEVKEKTIEAKDNTIEEKDKELDETKKLLAEKDKVIADLKKRLHKA
nr:hypothetical protein [Candidatus Sigynarchaeota archaeon]